MKTFTVCVTRTRIVTVDIDIEAESQEQAEELAIQGCEARRYEIDFNECEGSNEDEYEVNEVWDTEPSDF